MPTLQYMSRGFVHLVELPPESRWLRLRGPTIANFNLAGGPTTQAEFWQMRFNSHLRSLLVEIWLHEYRQGWSVWHSFFPPLPFFFFFFPIFVFHVYYLHTKLTTFSLSLLGGYTGLRHRISRWETYLTTELRLHISVPSSCLYDSRKMVHEVGRQGDLSCWWRLQNGGYSLMHNSKV